MKKLHTTILLCLGLLAVAIGVSFSLSADPGDAGNNPCTTKSPGPWSDWGCSESGVVTPGTLSFTEKTICIGDGLIPPIESPATIFSNGEKERTRKNYRGTKCKEYEEKEEVDVTYGHNGLDFEPDWPSSFDSAGVQPDFVVTVDGISSSTPPCDSLKATLKNVIITVVEVKEIIYQSGPSYVEFTDGDTSIEVEKGDSFTLKVVTNPPNTGEELLVWSGDGFSGSGFTKTKSYTNTGTKTATVTCGTSSATFTIYVNDNESDPIIGLEPSKDKKWAHAGDETILLEANDTVVDRDWFNGVKDEQNNYIDLEETTWAVPEGWGTVEPRTGVETVWTPPSGDNSNVGFTNITVIYNDDIDAYTPRDDESSDPITVEVGVFKTKVQLQLTGSLGTKTKTVDEDGNVVGDNTVSVSGSISSVSNRFTVENGGAEQENVSLTWTFLTIPGHAQPNGTIEADLSVSGSAGLKTKVYDTDLNDGEDVSIGIGASASGVGVSLSFSVNFGGDNHEGVAGVAAHFSSDAHLGNSDEKIEQKSSTYGDLFEGFPTLTDAFSLSSSPENVREARNAKVQGQFDFFAEADIKGTASATAEVNLISVTADVSGVSYYSGQ